MYCITSSRRGCSKSTSIWYPFPFYRFSLRQSAGTQEVTPSSIPGGKRVGVRHTKCCSHDQPSLLHDYQYGQRACSSVCREDPGQKIRFRPRRAPGPRRSPKKTERNAAPRKLTSSVDLIAPRRFVLAYAGGETFVHVDGMSQVGLSDSVKSKTFPIRSLRDQAFVPYSDPEAICKICFR